jgi:hypothetical protein
MDLVELAEDLKQRGMFLASAAQEFASPLWSERAYFAILALAKMKPTIHVDDVLRAFSEKPSHPNAWGAVYSRLIREHVIVHSGRVKPCTVDPTKHKHQSPVYLSLLYRRVS